MNSKNTRSSQELKKDVLRELNKVENDIDQLQQRMSPGQFIDDAIFYSRGSNPRATFDHLKANPIGTSFLALGTLLLMEDDRHQTYETSIRRATGDAVSLTRNKTSGALAEARSKVSNVSGKIKSKMHKEKGFQSDEYSGSALENTGTGSSKFEEVKEAFGSKIDETRESMGSKVSGMKGTIQSKIDETKNKIANKFSGPNIEGTESSNFSSKVKDMKEKVTSRMSDVRENVSGKIPDLKEKIKGQYEHGSEAARNLSPLTYVALGLGLGALSGASLPVSDKERSFVNHKIGNKMSQFGDELKQALDQSANIIKDEFLSTIKDVNVGFFKGSKGAETNQQSQI